MSTRKSTALWLLLVVGVAGAMAITARNWVDTQSELASTADTLDTAMRELRELERARKQGPSHTACDTVEILRDLRARGIDLPPYEVETRCKR